MALLINNDITARVLTMEAMERVLQQSAQGLGMEIPMGWFQQDIPN